jgi:hypothetical protein
VLDPDTVLPARDELFASTDEALALGRACVESHRDRTDEGAPT